MGKAKKAAAGKDIVSESSDQRKEATKVKRAGKKKKERASKTGSAGQKDKKHGVSDGAKLTMPAKIPGGYSVVVYRFGPSGTTRHLFVRGHSAKKNEEENPKPKGRTLFALNPPLGSPETLADICSHFGKVANVELTSLPAVTNDAKDTPAAYVVFNSPNGVTATLDADTSSIMEISPPDSSNYGLSCWEKQYDMALTDVETLQSRIDSDMRAFDDKVAKEKALRLAMHGKADDDGWIMVSRGAKANTDASGSERKKSKKDRELQNFYRFQIKEARKEQIAVLRQKFDQDKLKIRRMQENRKFRPY